MARHSIRYIVGIAGPPGAGKTTLVQGLSAAMHDTTAIHMDSYELTAQSSPQDVQQWLRNGADIDDFVIPGLVGDLEKLRDGKAVRDPTTGAEIAPRKYILFETRFGRAHRASGGSIDLLIWVETPLDIALARNLRTLIATFPRERKRQHIGERWKWLDDYLDNYLTLAGPLMTLQKRKVATGADLVVDGQLGIPELIRQTKQEILDRLP